MGKPGQSDLEDPVSGWKGRQSGQGLFAGAADTDQQTMTTWSPNYTHDLQAHQNDYMYRVAQKIVSYRTLSISSLKIDQFSQLFHQ